MSVMTSQMTSTDWRRAAVRNNILLLLCLELMTSSVCAELADDVELWLEDYTRVKNTNGDIQSDSPHGLSDEDPWEYECPIVQKGYINKSALQCLLPQCETDLDCDWPVYKCCYNGCLHTCLRGVPPPPYVDWRREPQRDPLTGISWLIGDDSEGSVKKPLARPNLDGRCQIDNTLYSDGAKFIHHAYRCLCQKGLVQCNVDTRRR